MEKKMCDVCCEDRVSTWQKQPKGTFIRVDEAGKPWGGNTAPCCFAEVTPVKKTHRKCRVCSCNLGPSRYYDCEACRTLNRTTYDDNSTYG